MYGIVSNELNSELNTGNYFNLSTDILCLIDSAGKFKLINPAFQETLGYLLSDLHSMPFDHIIHEDDLTETLYKFLNQINQSTEEQTISTRLKKKNGEIVDAECVITDILGVYYVNISLV